MKGRHTDISSVVVIGGGQAGAQAIYSLRQYGYEGAIRLIGDEAVLPYQRPPLSKAYMKGDLGQERLFFRQAKWYAENQVEMLLSETASVIDKAKKVVRCDSGAQISYDALVIATGARPRELSVQGADLKGVHYLRSVADVDGIRAGIEEGTHLVIVGAGYIGLEAAAVARQRGMDVTVIEATERVLSRVTGLEVSDFFESLHRAKGVDIRLSACLAALNGDDGVVREAVLENGESIDADMVLVGIGVLPNVELAANAGITVDDGIVVDEDCRTSDPWIFAAGDCTMRPVACYGRTERLESVHNAIEQGKLAAAAICARERPAIDCPWFWSDQYGVKLQIAGLSRGYDQTVVRGSGATGKFSVFYLRGGVVIGADAINSPRDFIHAKELVMSCARIPRSSLQDIAVPIDELIA
ncbi:NAD(P)/FAD-dependent oxidoreductase [Lentisalinibacter orientalis]|uniref:NAD(P)/FAD-dependent oxidoreductase n=1 Tax=Lentisalinibacter orientalis TaxID=2992241 RepID=UPI003868D149